MGNPSAREGDPIAGKIWSMNNRIKQLSNELYRIRRDIGSINHPERLHSFSDQISEIHREASDIKTELSPIQFPKNVKNRMKENLDILIGDANELTSELTRVIRNPTGNEAGSANRSGAGAGAESSKRKSSSYRFKYDPTYWMTSSPSSPSFSKRQAAKKSPVSSQEKATGSRQADAKLIKLYKDRLETIQKTVGMLSKEAKGIKKRYKKQLESEEAQGEVKAFTAKASPLMKQMVILIREIERTNPTTDEVFMAKLGAIKAGKKIVDIDFFESPSTNEEEDGEEIAKQLNNSSSSSVPQGSSGPRPPGPPPPRPPSNSSSSSSGSSGPNKRGDIIPSAYGALENGTPQVQVNRTTATELIEAAADRAAQRAASRERTQEAQQARTAKAEALTATGANQTQLGVAPGEARAAAEAEAYLEGPEGAGVNESVAGEAENAQAEARNAAGQLTMGGINGIGEGVVRMEPGATGAAGVGAGDGRTTRGTTFGAINDNRIRDLLNKMRIDPDSLTEEEKKQVVGYLKNKDMKIPQSLLQYNSNRALQTTGPSRTGTGPLRIGTRGGGKKIIGGNPFADQLKELAKHLLSEMDAKAKAERDALYAGPSHKMSNRDPNEISAGDLKKLELQLQKCFRKKVKSGEIKIPPSAGAGAAQTSAQDAFMKAGVDAFNQFNAIKIIFRRIKAFRDFMIHCRKELYSILINRYSDRHYIECENSIDCFGPYSTRDKAIKDFVKRLPYYGEVNMYALLALPSGSTRVTEESIEAGIKKFIKTLDEIRTKIYADREGLNEEEYKNKLGKEREDARKKKAELEASIEKERAYEKDTALSNQNRRTWTQKIAQLKMDLEVIQLRLNDVEAKIRSMSKMSITEPERAMILQKFGFKNDTTFMTKGSRQYNTIQGRFLRLLFSNIKYFIQSNKTKDNLAFDALKERKRLREEYGYPMENSEVIELMNEILKDQKKALKDKKKEYTTALNDPLRRTNSGSNPTDNSNRMKESIDNLQTDISNTERMIKTITKKLHQNAESGKYTFINLFDYMVSNEERYSTSRPIYADEEDMLIHYVSDHHFTMSGIRGDNDKFIGEIMKLRYLRGQYVGRSGNEGFIQYLTSTREGIIFTINCIANAMDSELGPYGVKLQAVWNAEDYVRNELLSKMMEILRELYEISNHNMLFIQSKLKTDESDTPTTNISYLEYLEIRHKKDFVAMIRSLIERITPIINDTYLADLQKATIEALKHFCLEIIPGKDSEASIEDKIKNIMEKITKECSEEKLAKNKLGSKLLRGATPLTSFSSILRKARPLLPDEPGYVRNKIPFRNKSPLPRLEAIGTVEGIMRHRALKKKMFNNEAKRLRNTYSAVNNSSPGKRVSSRSRSRSRSMSRSMSRSRESSSLKQPKSSLSSNKKKVVPKKMSYLVAAKAADAP